MGRINSYVADLNVQALDKWVGTDFAGGITKNFTAQNVSEYLNKANAVGIVGQCNFLFQTNLLFGRNAQTISFEAGLGNGTPFSGITTIKISKFATNSNIVVQYLENLVGGQIILSQVDNVNNFGVYTLTALTQDGVTDFYDAALTVLSANGSMAENKYYGISNYGTGSGGGSVNTVTSYRSSAVGLTVYAGYLLNSSPVITRYISGTIATAQGVTDLETDWANRLTLTYI
tara:strand:+ start:3516 stop:4208 length:693 start_codon:yes stop_codon:yes gene_type:complete